MNEVEDCEYREDVDDIDEVLDDDESTDCVGDTEGVGNKRIVLFPFTGTMDDQVIFNCMYTLVIN